MSSPTLIMHALEFNGAVTNFIDTYLNMLGSSTPRLFILHDRRVILNEFTVDLPVNVGTWLPFSIKCLLALINVDDHLVIDKQTMIDMITHGVSPRARRVTLLYPSLICEKFGYSAVTLEQINDFLLANDVTVVGNVFNRGLLSPDVRYVPWLLRLANDRISALAKRRVTNDVFSTAEYTRLKSLDVRIDAFSFASYHYARREVCPGVFFENIGKLVFEFAIAGRLVYYSSVNKMYNDGLSEYLSFLNVDEVDGRIVVDANPLVGPDDVVKKLLSR